MCVRKAGNHGVPIARPDPTKKKTTQMARSKVVGSRAEVWHGTAEKTSGGLKKADLMKNKYGRIVSRKRHEQGKVAYRQNSASMAAPFSKGV